MEKKSNFVFSEIIYQDYYIINNNIINKIIIERNVNNIIIKSNNYINKFNLADLSILIENKFDSINLAYEYIINIFENNRVIIKNKIINKEIILIFFLNNGKQIEISLYFNKQNNDFIINEINKLKNEIIYLKFENNKLLKEIELLKKNDINEIPKNIKLIKEITKDSFADYGLDNTFITFKSINNLLYLIYSNRSKSIICYDINKLNKITEIKYCHDEYITNLRHYLDELNKRDLIMSISNEDNNLKIWNVNKWECILNIPDVNKKGLLYSACFMKDRKQNYIITSNYNEVDNCENIKIFDFNGNKIKEMNDSNEITFLIDNYYDNIIQKNYIITGNLNYIKSYDYNNNELYYKYFDNNNGYHFSIDIYNNEEILKLIESCEDGNIRIWHFHSGLLLKKIKIADENLNGICLWNNYYLFVGCDDETIKLVDLRNELIVEEINGHNKEVLTIKKINHSIYGECLISQGYEQDQIKIWNLKN